ncbi:MAG: hypothetical protein E6G26_09540 [Actinobacteria bacterium]|nr:MAG: hypothetical protein E6G26_09540 [Actinomycetota bacterium]
MRFIAAALLILGALAAVGFARREDRIHQQKTLASVATELAGRQVGVHCPGFLESLVDTSGEAGRVQFGQDGRPANHTDLAPSTCAALRHIDRVDFTCLERENCGFKEFKAAWAAHTLAHESFHLRGFQDEGIAECYALQNTAFVAERLGVPTKQALELQAWVYKDGYPNEPEDYRSSNCYAGGPLDLRPQSPAFP